MSGNLLKAPLIYPRDFASLTVFVLILRLFKDIYNCIQFITDWVQKEGVLPMKQYILLIVVICDSIHSPLDIISVELLKIFLNGLTVKKNGKKQPISFKNYYWYTLRRWSNNSCK